MTLEERYKDDPDFLEFYKENLVVPGCAGQRGSSSLGQEALRPSHQGSGHGRSAQEEKTDLASDVEAE